MFKALFLVALLVCAAVAEKETTIAALPHKLAPKHSVAPESSNTECALCYDVMYDTLEIWFEVITYGGVFYSCDQFCQKVNGGLPCVSVCTLLGDEAFFKLIGEMQLDPVYYCQLLNACPVADCDDNSCDTAVIFNVTAKPAILDVPNDANDYTVNFVAMYNLTTPFKGTGSIYWEVQNQGVFVGNQGQLLVGATQGLHTATYSITLGGCGDNNIGGLMTTFMYLCEGECTQYGIPNHPNTKIMALGVSKWKVSNKCN